LFAHGILKIVYSPLKAFTEIIEKPKYAGPILIMILCVFANTAFGYVLMTKTYIDQTMPHAQDLDEWTENCTLWISNVGIPKCSVAHVNGVYYGNRSLDFTIVNGSQIWMRLNTSDPIDCSDPEGFKTLTFRAKWNSTNQAKPNATVYMYSVLQTDYFYTESPVTLTEADKNVWEKIQVPLGSDSMIWKAVGANAHWNNINSLELIFTWPSSSNVTLLIDGLFLHGIFKPAIEVAGEYLLDYPLTALMQFILQWVILGGSLFIFSRMFGVKAVWKVFLIIAGFVLITLFVQMVLAAAVSAALPELHYSLEALGGIEGESDEALRHVSEQSESLFAFLTYIEIAMGAWTFMLCAIAIYVLSEFSWMKKITINMLEFRP